MPKLVITNPENSENFIYDNYILIDLSYFIFYRYFALLNWWKLANKDIELGIPFENEEFVQKFKKTFLDKLYEIPKKLKINKTNYIIITAKDCPRKEIWRNKHFEQYKATREYDDSFMGGPFFELGINLIIKENIKLLYLDELEADDCIALTSKKILKNINSKNDFNKNNENNENNENNIYIIANDMDYLQLVNSNIKLINLQYKNLQENTKSTKNPECDLFCKVIMGDKSDNIPGIFKKCGIKTAIKYFNDKELFIKELNKNNLLEKFERNKKIIDFNQIPLELINKFYSNNLF